MADILSTDICVIGAGSGGLSVAAAAAMMQVPVVLIEKDRMGGDCLNVGCVPSKALIAVARQMAMLKDLPAFGIQAGENKLAYNRVTAHVKSVIAQIAPNDSVARFEALGAKVIKGEARFTDRRTVEVNGQKIMARRFVIATGSRPAIPPIPGLEDVPYLTNETLFDLTRRPQKLVVIGGGPIGVEMAQAHARLGSSVILVQRGRLLPREDRDVAELAKTALERSGVHVFEDSDVVRVEGAGEKLAVLVKGVAGEARIACTHILVATGRKPMVEGLGLERAGIVASETGIRVDSKLKTTNRKVYAIGDCIGAPYFTHRANAHAGLVLRNGLFRIPVKATDALLPRVTFIEPEIASIGLSEEEALKSKGARILRWPFSENDRAQADRKTEGFIKVCVDGRGRILGVSIIGHGAGDLLTPWTLAMANGLKITAMTGLTFPYPTYSEVSKRVATAFLLPKLRAPALQRVLRLIRIFG